MANSRRIWEGPAAAAHWDNLHSCVPGSNENSFALRRTISSAARVFQKPASGNGFLARRIKSQPGISPGKNSSIPARKIRFARLRSTALPTERPAATPILDVSSWLGIATNTTSGCGNDFPICRTRSKSMVRVRRNSRFTYSPVPGRQQWIHQPEREIRIRRAASFQAPLFNNYQRIRLV